MGLKGDEEWGNFESFGNIAVPTVILEQYERGSGRSYWTSFFLSKNTTRNLLDIQADGNGGYSFGSQLDGTENSHDKSCIYYELINIASILLIKPAN